MRIKCLTKFLDDKDCFEQGDERTVSDERGTRFCANGWAEDLSGVSAAVTVGEPSITLDVKSTRQELLSKIL